LPWRMTVLTKEQSEKGENEHGCSDFEIKRLGNMIRDNRKPRVNRELEDFSC